MPSTQIELHHRYKSQYWIIDQWHRKERFRMCHEAIPHQHSAFFLSQLCSSPSTCTYFVILSNILLGSRIKVGNTTRLKSAPGLNCEIICESTANQYQQGVSDSGITILSHHCLDRVQRRSSRLPRHPTSSRRLRTGCLLSHASSALILSRSTASSRHTRLLGTQNNNLVGRDTYLPPKPDGANAPSD